MKFGTANARSFVQTSPHSLAAIAPQGAGTVDVRVVTEGGKSPAATVDRFTYIPPMPPPAIKKLSANKGPAAGGTTVTITGEDFEGVTGVSFGSAAAASFSVTSPTSITAVAPPNVSEEVSVSVTTPNGTSAATSKTNFKTEGPTVTSVAPSNRAEGGQLARDHQGDRLRARDKDDHPVWQDSRERSRMQLHDGLRSNDARGGQGRTGRRDRRDRQDKEQEARPPTTSTYD